MLSVCFPWVCGHHAKVRRELARRHHRAQFENGSRYFNRSNREFSDFVRFFPSVKSVAEVAREKLGHDRNNFLWQRCYTPVYYIFMVSQLIKGDDSILPRFSKRISAEILKPRRVERIKRDFARFCNAKASPRAQPECTPKTEIAAVQQSVTRSVESGVGEAPVGAQLVSKNTEKHIKTPQLTSSQQHHVRVSSQENHNLGTKQSTWCDAIEKMEDFEFAQLFAAHEQLKSRVADFESEMEKLEAKREKRRAARKSPTKMLREAQEIAESVYPARQVPSLIPISHWFHHRPHDVNCPTCNRAKMITLLMQ